MIEEFVERDEEMIRIFRYRPENSVFFRTNRQDVAVLDTLLFGRTLFLDGILQSAQKDEEIYHRLLVHSAMGHNKASNNVLVLGGGEGATLREILKWDVEKITMIDWDQELVEYFKEKEPTWHRGAFTDPRVELEFRDVFEIIEEERKYGVIIVDLVDPSMEDPRWRHLLERLVRWLEPRGTLIVNAGGVFPWDEGEVPAIRTILNESAGLEEVRLHQHKMFVPSFGREWAFVVLKKS